MEILQPGARDDALDRDMGIFSREQARDLALGVIHGRKRRMSAFRRRCCPLLAIAHECGRTEAGARSERAYRCPPVAVHARPNAVQVRRHQVLYRDGKRFEIVQEAHGRNAEFAKLVLRKRPTEIGEIHRPVRDGTSDSNDRYIGNPLQRRLRKVVAHDRAAAGILPACKNLDLRDDRLVAGELGIGDARVGAADVSDQSAKIRHGE